MADKTLRSITFPGLGDRYVIPEQVSIDATLSQQGKAADAKAVGDALKAQIAPAYSTSSTYAVGDLVLYNNALYRCKTAITTAEAWTPAHWEATTLNDVARKVTDLESASMELDASKAPVIVGEASGSIASFGDGADGLPMESLVAAIEPVQDLHGFDHPWPAGGGKNKVRITYSKINAGEPFTVNDVTFTPVLNGAGSVLSITANGTASDRTTIVLTNNISSQLQSGNYILSGCPSGGGSGKFRITCWDSTESVTLANDYGQGASFTLDNTHNVNYAIDISSGVTVNNLVFYPMIRLATETDATFEPYSNICPITGRTGLSGKRTGKNLAYFANGMRSSAGVAFVFADGVITANGTASGNALSGNDNLYLPAGTYRVFNLAAQSDGAYISVQNSEDSAAWPTLANTSGSRTDTFTLTRWTKLSVRARIPSGVTATNMVFKPMIVAGTAAPAEFEPNVSQDISVNWQSQAGTVYGGTVDVVSGKLVADRAIVTGTWSKSPDYNHVFYRTGIGNKTFPVLVLSDVISNILPTVQANSLSALDNMDYGIRVTDIIYAVNKDCSTAEEFNAWATQSGLQVVYTLATPVEYQLTPQEVTTLLGNNVVYTDVGPVSVTAPRDTKMYVDNKIAEAVAAALNA